GDAGDADPVVPARGDDAGDVGAVAVVVGRVPAAVQQVDPVDVVDEAVAVVVEPVVGDLARVRPEVGRQVAVREVDTRVHDRHGDGAGRRPGPGAGGAHRSVAPHGPLLRAVGVAA